MGGRERQGLGDQGIAGGQEVEAPAQEPSRNEMSDLVTGAHCLSEETAVLGKEKLAEGSS